MQPGVILLGTAVALGITLRTVGVLVPGRLDAALSAGVIILVVSALTATRVVRLPPRIWQLAVPATLLTAAMLWRDSEALFVLDLAAFAAVLVLLVPHARAPRLARAGITDYLRAGVAAAAVAAAGPLPLAVRDVRWAAVPLGPGAVRLRRVGLGLAAALPCVLVFGSLFRSADPAYDRVVSRITFDLGPLGEHAAVTLACAWVAAGYLWLAFRSARPRRLIGAHGRAGGIELTTALGAVLVLFVSFMAFQISYLFGGEAAMRAMGLTHAEYARRGFFELVAVTVLALPLLLGADWALASSDTPGRRRLRMVMGALVLVLLVLLASALDRMRLYTSMYGLTELRLYTTAFMGWLALVLGWFVATVLRGRRPRFAWGAAVAGWLVLGALHLINPDGLIVTTNAAAPRPFDAAYATELSGDAIPALLDVAARAPDRERCALVTEVIGPLAAAAERNDRWTLGRVQARRALAQAPRVECPPG